MRKKDYGIVIGVLLLVWALDAVTKWWAFTSLSLTDRNCYGPLCFILHYNKGVALGSFSGLPMVLRVVVLSTVGVCLLAVYAGLQAMIVQRVMLLRVGMSILVGGILGNISDRIYGHAVVDSLFVRLGAWNSPVFNVADVVQWIAYPMIVYSVFKHTDMFWPVDNARKQKWVLPKFQKHYVGMLMGIGVAFSLVLGVFSYTYLSSIMGHLMAHPPSPPYTSYEQGFLIPFVMVQSCISFVFLLLLFWFGLKLSHRTAGPLYAFEKFLDDLMEGKSRALKLREGDRFTHLEELSEKLRKKMLPEASVNSAVLEDPVTLVNSMASEKKQNAGS